MTAVHATPVVDIGQARACVQDPALFASTDVVDHRHAARFCRVCPVLVACGEATEETAKHRPDLLHGTYADRRFGGGTA